jgi:hypothetical protein
MAKGSGLGITTLSVDDSTGAARVIKNDFTEFTVSTPRAVQDITGIDRSAIERLLLLADLSLSLKGVYNDTATTSAHAVFSTVPSTSVSRNVTLGITNVALRTLACKVLFTDYQLTRTASGELNFDAPGVLADGSIPTWA